MRGDQLIRQWKIVSLLSSRAGRSLDQLKAELGVTKRTIQRDIAVLEAAGFPVTSDRAMELFIGDCSTLRRKRQSSPLRWPNSWRSTSAAIS
jgi:predicted DNA-binding transcriptional regulator YafY